MSLLLSFKYLLVRRSFLLRSPSKMIGRRRYTARPRGMERGRDISIPVRWTGSSCGTRWEMAMWERELQFVAASSIKVSRSQGLFWRGVSAVISVTSSRAVPR